MTLYEILKVNSEVYGNREAIIYKNKVYSWKELYLRVNRLANGLSKLGVKKGDKGGILLHNCPEYIEIMISLQRINAIPVPIHTRFSIDEIIDYVKYCDVSVIFSSQEFIDTLNVLRRKLDSVKHWILTGEKRHEDYICYEELIKQSSQKEPKVKAGEEKIAIIFPTAGTTGKPKPAVLKHETLESILEIIPSYTNFLIDVFPDEEVPISIGKTKFLIPAPIYHVAGFMPVITQIAMKNTIIFTSSMKFNPEEVCKLIEKYRISVCFMVPTMYKKLLDFKDLHKYNLKCLKLLGTGGSKMPLDLKKKLLETFKWAILIDGYGSTETVGGVTISVLKYDDIHKIADGYVGKPYPQIKVKIVDENGRELGPGQVGELVVKTPALFSGYYKDKEMSLTVLKDGWYYTRDLCMMDEDGNIYYIGRKDEVIITGGEKVYSHEIEEILRSHPKVKDAAVLGVPDPLWGEKVKALIVLERGVSATKEEIINFCKNKIAKYKVPKIIQFVDSIPYTDDGKIHRVKLKELFGGR